MPTIVPHIRELNDKVDDLEKVNAELRKNSTAPVSSPKSASTRKGTAFIDPDLDLIFAVLSTSPDDSAVVRLQLPGQDPIEEKHAVPGQRWGFQRDSARYYLTISQITFVTDQVDVQITKVE